MSPRFSTIARLAAAATLIASVAAGTNPRIAGRDAGQLVDQESPERVDLLTFRVAANDPADPDVTIVPGKEPEFMHPSDVKEDEDADEGESTEANVSDTYSNKYLYNQRNGVVQTSPRVDLIFWGPTWATSTGDPYSIKNRLYYFYRGLANTSYGDVLTQYQTGCTPGTWNCSGAHAGNPSNPFRGWWKDTRSVPTTPTQSQMAYEARRAAAHFGDYSYNAQYVIALPHGHADDDFVSKGGDACAWHFWTKTNEKWISYTSLPYMTDSSRCYMNWVHKTGGRLDGVTMVAGHEYAESVTDPIGGGWLDSDGEENGDKCSTYGADVTLSNGRTYPMQATWSNYHRYYYGYGCVWVW